MASVNKILSDLRRQRNYYKKQLPNFNKGEQYYAFYKGKVEALTFAIHQIESL